MSLLEVVSVPESTEPDMATFRIDINQSTEEDWIRLPGIGPTYAGKILRFREALGGFCSVDQVGETWNIPDSVFQQIRPYLNASAPYRMIAINQSSEEELAAHPYLNSKQARVIIRYRSHYGPISDMEGLRKTGVLKEQDITRLAAYILF